MPCPCWKWSVLLSTPKTLTNQHCWGGGGKTGEVPANPRPALCRDSAWFDRRSAPAQDASMHAKSCISSEVFPRGRKSVEILHSNRNSGLPSPTNAPFWPLILSSGHGTWTKGCQRKEKLPPLLPSPCCQRAVCGKAKNKARTTFSLLLPVAPPSGLSWPEPHPAR